GGPAGDGSRCLLRCGAPEPAPRRRAARAWLVRHFRPGLHPGGYPEGREPDRMAVYYYYAAALGWAGGALAAGTGGGPAPLHRLLAEELLRRQREGGSGSNPAPPTREGDPVVAPPFALIALA